MAGQSQHTNSVGRRSKLVALLSAEEKYAIDVSGLTANLRRSHTERIRRHNIAVNTVERLRQAEVQ